MTRLHIRVPTREDWPKFLEPKISGGGLFCPSSSPPGIASQVVVEVTFVGGPRFILAGIVLWRRTQQKDPRARGGAGIQVVPGDRGKLSFISAWARGGLLDKRENRRLPVRLRASYSVAQGRRINFTRDISPNGIFVRAAELLDVDTAVQLTLAGADAKAQPLNLRGVVARRVEDPEDQGMGIRLEFRDPAARAHYVAFMDDLTNRYLTGTLPDDVLI